MADEINVKFGADIADIQSKLSALQSQFTKTTDGIANGTKQAAQTTQTSFSKIENSVNGVKAALAPLLAVFAPILAALGASSIINTASEFEQLEIRLRAVMGSAAEGDNAFKWIKQFAVETPYSVQQTTDAFMTLKNFGLDPMDGSLQKISDASAKYGKSAETAQRVTLALGQAWARGKLQGQDTLQMIDAGIPVYDLLSKATGKTAAEIQNMSEKGTMGRDVMRKLIDQMGVEGAGAAAAKMNSYAGAVSNMGDAFGNAIDKLRKQGGFDFLTQGILKFTETIPAIVDLFGTACSVIGEVFKTLWSIVSDVLTAIGGMFNAVFGSGGEGLTAMQAFIFGLKTLQAGVVALRMIFELAFEGIKFVLMSFIGYIMAAADASREFFAGNFMKVGSAWRDALATREAVLKQSVLRMKEIATKGRADIDAAFDNRASTEGKIKNTKVNTAGDIANDKKGGKEKSAIPLMDEELTQAKINMLKTRELGGQGREMDKAEEMAFWMAKKALKTTSAADAVAIQKKLSADELAIAREGNQALLAEVRSMAEEYKAKDEQKRATAEKFALADLDIARAEIAQMKALGQISDMEELAALRKLEEEKTSIQTKAAIIRRDQFALDSQAYQKANDEISAISRDGAAKIKGIDNQATLAKRKEWDDMMKPVTDALDKSINGVIAGTTTIRKAFADLAQSIVLEITNNIIKNGIKKMMDAMFQNQGGSGTGGTSSGGGGSGGMGGLFSSVMHGLNIPGFAVGAWNLPNDTLAMVHKGETIIPAAQAEKFRAGAMGGGTNMNVSNSFILSGNPDRGTQEQMALMASSAMNNAMRRNG